MPSLIFSLLVGFRFGKWRGRKQYRESGSMCFFSLPGFTHSDWTNNPFQLKWAEAQWRAGGSHHSPTKNSPERPLQERPMWAGSWREGGSGGGGAGEGGQNTGSRVHLERSTWWYDGGEGGGDGGRAGLRPRNEEATINPHCTPSFSHSHCVWGEQRINYAVEIN